MFLKIFLYKWIFSSVYYKSNKDVFSTQTEEKVHTKKYKSFYLQKNLKSLEGKKNAFNVLFTLLRTSFLFSLRKAICTNFYKLSVSEKFSSLGLYFYHLRPITTRHDWGDMLFRNHYIQAPFCIIVG